MAKYVTILDIAKELGISKSTVSRALSGDTANVKAATITETALLGAKTTLQKHGFRIPEDVVLRGETIFRESFPEKNN